MHLQSLHFSFWEGTLWGKICPRRGSFLTSDTCSSHQHLQYNRTIQLCQTLNVHILLTMLRKQILRQSRALSESFTSTSAASLPQLRRAHFSSSPITPTLRPSPSSTLPSRWMSRRYQSTEAEKKPQDETPAATEAKPTEEAKEDAQKAELEKKNKEIIDLKVRGLLPCHQPISSCNFDPPAS